MKNLKVTPIGGLVKTQDKEDMQNGIVGFQMLKVEFDFYGNIQSEKLDTKVMKDGKRIVIDGNGWIKAGTEL